MQTFKSDLFKTKCSKWRQGKKKTVFTTACSHSEFKIFHCHFFWMIIMKCSLVQVQQTLFTILEKFKVYILTLAHFCETLFLRQGAGTCSLLRMVLSNFELISVAFDLFSFSSSQLTISCVVLWRYHRLWEVIWHQIMGLTNLLFHTH